MDSDNESLATSIVSSTHRSVDTSLDDLEPPPYSQVANTSPAPQTSSSDVFAPAPPTAGPDSRRKLLLIFTHGLGGNESSFRAFPSHLHNLLSVLLSESHVIHTKIYPRYPPRDSLASASQTFSSWLAPHESPTTDVILLGHSMGGILNAETALLPARDGRTALLHRIIGTVNFDVPFLGLHPGVVKAGLGSIFRPTPSPRPPNSDQQSNPESASHSSVQSLEAPDFPSRPSDHLLDAHLLDPNYNPAFENDIHLTSRSGWRNAAHFIVKHRQDLINSTKRLIASHVEHGGALAKYENLRIRYCRIRMLEEDDELKRRSVVQGFLVPARVRFVNYYTTCTPPIKIKDANRTLSNDYPTTVRPTMEREKPIGSNISKNKHSDRPGEHMEGSASNRVGSDSDTSSLQESDLEIFDPLVSGQSSHTGTHDSGATNIPPTMPALEHAHTAPAASSHAAPSTPLGLPQFPLPPPPPLITNYRSDFTGYRQAVKQWHRDIKSYNHAVSGYHRALREHSKAEARRLHSELKMQLGLKPRKSNSSVSKEEPGSAPVESLTLPDKKEIKLALRERKKAEKEAGSVDLAECSSHNSNAESSQLKAQRHCQRRAEKEEHKNQKRREKSIERKARRAEKHEHRVERRADRMARRRGKSVHSDDVVEFDQEDEAFNDLGKRGTETESIPQEEAPAYSEIDKGLDAANQDSTSENNSITRSGSAQAAARPEEQSSKKKKDRKFCVLPPKDESGNRDPTWVRTHLEGMDEVAAHCGLFFSNEKGAVSESDQAWSERYARLVGEVAERVEGWVHLAETERVVASM